MKDLVFVTSEAASEVPFTTSDVIAECTKVTHHAVQVLIDKQKNRLEKFGRGCLKTMKTS